MTHAQAEELLTSMSEMQARLIRVETRLVLLTNALGKGSALTTRDTPRRNQEHV